MKYFIALSLLCAMTMVQACTVTGVAAGAAAGTGIAVAQEGGLKRAISDAVIQAKINELWLREDSKIFTKLDLTVNQGRVLVTGVVQNPEHRVQAIRLAWMPDGVTQVLNEVQVANSTGITGFARDAWAKTRLRTMITLDRDVQSINYSIDIVQGVVYLMGVAQNRTELNRVIETARTIPDIKQVVSYVKLAGVQPQAQTYQTLANDVNPYEDNDGYAYDDETIADQSSVTIYDQKRRMGEPTPVMMEDRYEPPAPVQQETLNY